MQWKAITEATYYERIEVLPPTAVRHFAFATAVLFGDIADHFGANDAARYTAYLRITSSPLGIGTLCYESATPIALTEFESLKLPAGTSFFSGEMDDEKAI